MKAEQKAWFHLYSAATPHKLAEPQASMIDIFEGTVERMPDAPALYYFDQTITFAELDHYANCLASLFMDWGIGPGDRVALYLQNDPQFLIAQYATWKRGAIVVPLNPMFKEKELRYYFQDSGACCLICLDSLYTDEVHNVVAETMVKHVIVTNKTDFLERGASGMGFPGDRTWLEGGSPSEGAVNLAHVLSNFSPHPLARETVRPADTAYLVYTSGTTGQPKGAMNLHKNIAFNAEVYRTWMNMDTTDVILGIAPLFHVTGIVGHIALSALAGVPLVLFHRFDAKVALEMVNLRHPTMTVGSITAFIAMMNHPESRQADFRSMKKCYSGGAPIPSSVVEQFEQTFGVYIHNIYGLTETNSPSHAVPIDQVAPVDPATGALSIGIPIPNCDAKVVSLSGPAPVEVERGELGELALKGPMVFAGYWQKDEATEKAFYGGYFLTGDVVRMDDEGWFYVVDRKKDVIIASGFKVWPREVEDVLYQHPAVKEAAVIGVPDDYRGETVKAFVSLKEAFVGSVSEEEIGQFCKERLAAYKYPRQVEIVTEIPKTATGKVLRRVLKTQTESR